MTKIASLFNKPTKTFGSAIKLFFIVVAACCMLCLAAQHGTTMLNGPFSIEKGTFVLGAGALSIN